MKNEIPIGSAIWGTGTDKPVTELKVVTNMPVYLKTARMPRFTTTAATRAGLLFFFGSRFTHSAQR